MNLTEEIISHTNQTNGIWCWEFFPVSLSWFQLSLFLFTRSRRQEKENTVVPNDQKSRHQYWATCSSVCSLCLLVCSLANSRARGKVNDLCWDIRVFWTIVEKKKKTRERKQWNFLDGRLMMTKIAEIARVRGSGNGEYIHNTQLY